MSSNFLYDNPGKKYRLIFFVSAGVVAVLFLYRLLLIFSYNGELAGIDNNFVYDVARGITGSGPYTHPAQPPYAITLYAPLYFTACSLLGKLFQIDPDHAISVYQLCRSVSLLADLITCILLYRILRKRFHTDKGLAWLAMAAFACILCKLGYTFSRSDSFLLVFYAALLYVLTNPSRKGTGRIILLSLFSVGCILSKQNGIIMPVIVIAWLWLTDEKKAVLYYCVAALVTGAIFLSIYRVGYPYLFLNTVTALRNRVDPAWFYSDIFKRSMDSLWILPLYFAVVFSVLRWKNPGREYKAFAAILIIQVLFDLAISLKWGSSVSYFNESFFLAFVILFRRTTDQQQTASVNFFENAIITLPLLVLFLAHTVTEGYLFFLQHRESKKKVYSQQEEIRNYLRLQLKEKYILNLADPNTSFFKTLFYKEVAVPNVDMADCCTIPDQNFDYSSLKQDLTNGKIGYIILPGQERPTTIWNVSLEHFVKDTSLYGYSIYAVGPAIPDSAH